MTKKLTPLLVLFSLTPACVPYALEFGMGVSDSFAVLLFFLSLLLLPSAVACLALVVHVWLPCRRSFVATIKGWAGWYCSGVILVVFSIGNDFWVRDLHSHDAIIFVGLLIKLLYVLGCATHFSWLLWRTVVALYGRQATVRDTIAKFLFAFIVNWWWWVFT